MTEHPIPKIYELLEDFDTAMLVTQADGEEYRARPMAIARVDAHSGLWFFTGRDTAKVRDIERHSRVLITCQDEHHRYLWISGKAELTADRDQTLGLWKESYRSWFPKGLEDPNLLLIFVRPEKAEYWDNHGTKSLRYVFEAARAYLTGTKPRIQEGEQHAKLVMH